mgnify:CR=1 FL=1
MEGIFKDEKYLYTDYLPEKLPHRDEEIETIAEAYKPAARGKKPVNLFIMGPSGIGKTACVKYVIRKLSEYSARALHIYINCFECNTRLGILSFLNSKFGNPVPRRGISIEEAYEELKESIAKAHTTPIVILDEADQLIYRNSLPVLYDILRLQDAVSKPVGITLITNNPRFDLYLEPRIESSLAAEYLHFEPYTPQQLKDILWQRVEKAFFKEKVERDAINLVAAYAAKHKGDCRLALEALLKAGRIAERKSDMLKVQHIKDALARMEKNPARKYLYGLEENEKLILYLLAKNNGSMTSGQLYQNFQSISKLSDRRIRSILSRLKELKLIKLEDKIQRGKTRLITLSIDPELILSNISKV